MNRSSPVGMMLQFAFGPGPGGGMAGELTPQMRALAAAASAWWEDSRPAGWSLERHLAEPTAGCDGTVQEQALAEAVACWIRQGG